MRARYVLQLPQVLCAAIVLAVFIMTCRAEAGTPADPLLADGNVIHVVRDFEDGRPGEKRAAAMYGNWTPEQKTRALEYSSIEIVGGAAVGEKCLKPAYFGHSDVLTRAVQLDQPPTPNGRPWS